MSPGASRRSLSECAHDVLRSLPQQLAELGLLLRQAAREDSLAKFPVTVAVADVRSQLGGCRGPLEPELGGTSGEAGFSVRRATGGGILLLRERRLHPSRDLVHRLQSHGAPLGRKRASEGVGNRLIHRIVMGPTSSSAICAAIPVDMAYERPHGPRARPMLLIWSAPPAAGLHAQPRPARRGGLPTPGELPQFARAERRSGSRRRDVHTIPVYRRDTRANTSAAAPTASWRAESAAASAAVASSTAAIGLPTTLQQASSRASVSPPSTHRVASPTS